MSKLEKLQLLNDLSGLAKLLGFTPAGLAYILYRMPEDQKYRSFEIAKRSGGKRQIHAPNPELSLLQKRLKSLLNDCVSEIRKDYPRFWMPSHGFRKERTIVSNAAVHKRKRYVFNVDIQDFFGSINFGRVRGFFIKDRSFLLNDRVATIIAQIACYKNALPQGSPCSPVISNLIGNIIDMRLVAIARDHKCYYSRYADDLTFSTNERVFPPEVALNIADDDWVPGEALVTEIGKLGFSINPKKTRMDLSRSRQTVTGLVVNSKPNINSDFYRVARAMCNELFQRGYYYRATKKEELMTNLRPLEGLLSHIYFVKHRRDRSFEQNKMAKESGGFVPPKAIKELYRKFLVYKHFVGNSFPTIVPEGKTDTIYMRAAIKQLASDHPSLASIEEGEVSVELNFLHSTQTAKEVLGLGHGSGGQVALIKQYHSLIKRYGHRPLHHPTIIVCDNDNGASDIFKAAGKMGVEVSASSTEPFYHLGENLYLVKVPENGHEPVEMEDFFPQEWLLKPLDGKHFDRSKLHGDESSFGKAKFAEFVVKPNAQSIDFGKFGDLLTRLSACIEHYSVIHAQNSSPDAQHAGAAP
ncbi:MAG: retron Ec67 family RNA-directed DNA polymerase/endonuclease [Henriciella sp.]